MATRAVPQHQIVGGTTTSRTAGSTRTVESVEAVKVRVRNGPSPIAGFTPDGIRKMAAAEADGHAFAGARRKK
ncbi:hypothetical protein [Gemmatimonas sp.]|uniref:hypothetical protein n=1 Tax=Gemmatimonas sp. TaxID=1962908 RepID=UPI00356843A3